MARLRLGYTKSRNGCLRCKQRRVKCDENQPCRACIRHNVECSLVSSSSASRCSEGSHTPSPQPSQQSPLLDKAPPLRPLAPSHPSPLSDHPPILDHHLNTPDVFEKFIIGHPHDDTTNWVADLELLHHFTTTTSKTLFTSESSISTTDRASIWQVEVPKMGFVYTFLLHQILALSAFHLAYLHPHLSKKYSLQASQHQSIAIQGTREELSNITSENCHALFAASSLFFLGALAAERPNPHTPDGPTVEHLVDIFYLVKGVGGLLNNSETTLRQGPFGLFFTNTATGEANLTLERVSDQIDKFLLRVMEIPGEDPVRAIIEAEIANLAFSIKKAVAYSQMPEYRIIASWPILMTDKFIALLRQRNQVALALLSYYCVVMHGTEAGYWFTRGWSFRVIQDISRDMTAPWDEYSVWALGWITGHTEAP